MFCHETRFYVLCITIHRTQFGLSLDYILTFSDSMFCHETMFYVLCITIHRTQFGLSLDYIITFLDSMFCHETMFYVLCITFCESQSLFPHTKAKVSFWCNPPSWNNVLGFMFYRLPNPDFYATRPKLC